MSYTVTLPYDPVWRPLDWAREHCPSYITNTVNKTNVSFFNRKFQIDYIFGEERDAVLFALKWAEPR